MLQVPKSPEYKTTTYDKLTGADFSDEQCSPSRSPDLLNMISDYGGTPIKRQGWEIYRRETSAILNLWSFKYVKKYLVAFVGGTKIIDVKTGETVFSDGNTYKGACGFFFGSSKHTGFYVFLRGGPQYKTKYLRFTTNADESLVSEEVPFYYIPIIREHSRPDGTGGQAAEAVNLLTREVRFLFSVDPTETVQKFVLNDRIDITKPAALLQFSYGNWWGLNVTIPFTLEKDEHGVVSLKFNSPQQLSMLPKTENNLMIQAELDRSDESGVIFSSNQALIHTQMTESQVFVARENSSKVYYSALGDPTYFPDTNYVFAGHTSQGTLTLAPFSSSVVVIREPIFASSTLFLLSPSTVTDTVIEPGGGQHTRQRYIYTVKSGVSGTSSISSNTMGILNNEPLFLSNNGISALTSISVNDETVIRNRSGLIDPRLTKEPDLKNAVSVTWKNYYILAVNGHCYILDGRKKTYDKKGNTSYLYESYFWNNVPAKCIMSDNEKLWFGTESGDICRFKERDAPDCYHDGTVFGYETMYVNPQGVEMSSTWFKDDNGQTITPQTNTNYILNSGTENYSRGDVFVWNGAFEKTGQAIHAVWSSPLDNDGKTNYYKTLQKKGTGCTVVPYSKSSVKVYFQKDDSPKIFVGYFPTNQFNWEKIDFSKFFFNLSEDTRDLFTHKKIKKYKRLKIYLKNDEPFEAFGVQEIFKTFVITKFAKR